MRLAVQELVDRCLERLRVVEVRFVEGKVSGVCEAACSGHEGGMQPVAQLVGAACPLAVLRVLVAELLDVMAREGVLLRVVVRETLSEDLIERLVIDILEVSESIMSELNLKSSCTLIDTVFAESKESFMSVSAASQVRAHPDHDQARPELENFADGTAIGGPEQIGFSSQC